MFKARIFGIGKTGADSIAGHLECELDFRVDQEHFIKGEWWTITKVSKNIYDEPLLDLKRSEKDTWHQTLHRIMGW